MGSHAGIPEIVKDAVIIVYLMNPREKVWGLLIDLGPAGAWVRGMDLNSFDDWLRSQTLPPDQRLTPSIGFYPMARVEKIFVEDASEGAGSLESQCLARTGRTLRECIIDVKGNQTMGGGVGE